MSAQALPKSIASRHWGWMAALFLLSASTLQFEVLLTKFFSNKLEHHYTFAVISIALLGFGAAGVYVQLRRKVIDLEQGQGTGSLAHYALAYALALPLSVLGFIVAPFDPGQPGWLGSIALPLYFLLFAVPFFLAGVCISALLVAKGTRASVIYFWDLLGAGLGALASLPLLFGAGGYAAVVVASACGFASALLMRWQKRERALRWTGLSAALVVITSALTLWTPLALRQRLGFDIVSFKHTPLREEFLTFGGMAQTYWNPIARLDVSPTGSSQSLGFRYGLARRLWGMPLLGRMVLVDGSANTRQYYFDQKPDQSSVVASALWAAPYVLRPESQRTLVVGPGGGIDILIGKVYGAREIDALELNPDMAKLLQGRAEDPERKAYTQWLGTDETTRVRVINSEARHFVHAHQKARPYDIVLASGVDTLTAIQTAGNALSENFLYTKEAVQDYLQLLRPGGMLALTHWHFEPPTLALRMWLTYLQVLEEAGVKEPGRHVCMLSEGYWESAILKKGEPFTQEEIERLRQFARANGYQVVYDPMMAQDAPLERLGDILFRLTARAEPGQRAQYLKAFPYDVTPATDERPFFYWIRPNESVLRASDDGGWLFPQASVRWMFVLAVGLSVLMSVGPALLLGLRKQHWKEPLRAVPFFAATGFAFILAENGLFLGLTLFVGGPLYSLAVLLPSMLVGYSVGSLVSNRLVPARRTGAYRLALMYGFGFVLFGIFAQRLMPLWMGQTALVRVLVAAAAVVPFGALLGLASPWYMDRLKARAGSAGALAWYWGVSSAANVLGSLMFVPLCQQLGLRTTLGLSGLMYTGAMLAVGLGLGPSFVAHPGVGAKESSAGLAPASARD